MTDTPPRLPLRTRRKQLGQRLAYGAIGLLALMAVGIFKTIGSVSEERPHAPDAAQSVAAGATSDTDSSAAEPDTVTAPPAASPMTAAEAALAIIQANHPPQATDPPVSADGPQRNPDGTLSGPLPPLLRKNGGVRRR